MLTLYVYKHGERGILNIYKKIKHNINEYAFVRSPK